MNVQPGTRNHDHSLAAELAALEEHIRHRLRGRVHDFQLLVRDDGLVLQGRTRTYYAKQLAQQAVLKIAKLPIRANEIKVT